jgi:hypothetical protein
MIPKIIHYGWFGDSTKKPVDRISQWKNVLPEYEFKEWNESNSNIDKYRLSRIAYDAKSYAFVSDFLRADVLYEYGGIWLDTDVIVHENLEPFLHYSFFLGYEDPTFFNIGTIGSEPCHPIFTRACRWYSYTDQNVSIKQLKTKKEVAIYMLDHYLTGARILHNSMVALYNFFVDGKAKTIGSNVRIEPPPVFTIRGNYGIKNYTEHLFDGSWRDNFPSFNNFANYTALLKIAYEKNTRATVWDSLLKG